MNEWLCALLTLTSTALAAPRPGIHELITVAANMEPVTEIKLGGGVPLRLADLAESVKVYHPMLAAAEQRRQQAEGVALSARGGFDPILALKASTWPVGFYDFNRVEAKIEQPTPLWGASLFGSYRLGVGSLPVYQEQNETLDDGELKAGINVPLWRDGPIDERRARIRQSANSARSAAFDRDTTRLSLLLEAAGAYWKWAAAGQSYKIALDLVRLAELRDRQLAEKVKRGAVAEIDRAENLRAVLDRRQDLVAAERVLLQAAIKVSLFLRNDDGQPEVPTPARLPDIPDPVIPQAAELETGRSQAFERRPEISFYMAEVARAEVGLRLARNQLAPQVNLEASIAKDFGTDDEEKNIESLTPTELKLGLTLKMPFFLRKERGKRVQAEAKLNEVEQKARFQRDKIGAQIQNLWAALNAQARQSQLADETFRIAEAVAAAERRRFDLGATTLFIVNLREQKAAEAARKRIKARADYSITRSAWGLATRTDL